MFPAGAPVKVRPSQNRSTKFASSGIPRDGNYHLTSRDFSRVRYLDCFPFSMPRDKYFSIFCLLRVELKLTEQQAVCKGNDK